MYEPRSSLLVTLLVISSQVSWSSEPQTAGRLVGRLSEKLRSVTREGFAGEDEFKPFRELAYDAAVRLSASQFGPRFDGWCAILREVLRQMPECDALAA